MPGITPYQDPAYGDRPYGARDRYGRGMPSNELIEQQDEIMMDAYGYAVPMEGDRNEITPQPELDE